jgi:hypothetical protein
MARRTKKVSRRHRGHKGAGWSDGPQFIKGAPGYIEHHSFSGPQRDFSPYTDCTGNPMSHRAGWINPGTDMSVRGGLPGMKGGKQRRKRGGADPTSMATLGSFNGTPAEKVITPLPGYFSNPAGRAGSVSDPDTGSVVAVQPGGAVPEGATVSKDVASNVIANGQKGGRYGFFPGMGPLSPSNGIGSSPSPFGRIACEVGAPNPLNPDPKGIQTLYTAPLAPAFTTGPPRAYSSLPFMSGGGMNMNLAGAPTSAGSSGYSVANFPPVQVGAADMMKYEAPTAGYSHAFQTFKAPSPVPALMINTPYDARTFNPACIKTGGGRRTRRKHRKGRKTRGGSTESVARDAGQWSPVTMSEITTRKMFDGTSGLLPTQFAGTRRKRHGKKNRTSCKKRK